MKIDMTGIPDYALFPLGHTGPFDFRRWRASAGMRVIAHMAWPGLDDDARRRGFLAKVAASQIDFFKKRGRPDSWPEEEDEAWNAFAERAAADILADDFMSNDGFGSILYVEALDELFADAWAMRERWLAAGAQLSMCRRIDAHHDSKAKGGASRKKAVAILERTTRWNASGLDRDWRAFRAIAHFCAAFHDLKAMAERRSEEPPASHPLRGPDFWFYEALEFLLAAASAYEQWATAYFPYGRDTPLLDSVELWHVPNEFSLPSYSVLPPPLNENELQALEGYSAPKRAI